MPIRAPTRVDFSVFGLEGLGGRFGYFLFFCARERGRRNPRRQKGGGGSVFIENPRRGGGFPGGGGGRHREGVWREFGGGLNIFFRGRNSHQD